MIMNKADRRVCSMRQVRHSANAHTDKKQFVFSTDGSIEFLNDNLKESFFSVSTSRMTTKANG